MKRFILVLLLVAFCMPSFAAYQDLNERMAEKAYKDQQFDVLYSTTAATLTNGASINFRGITAAMATGTTPIAIPATRPIKIRIQNLTANILLYNNFSSNTTSTVYPTATTASQLIGITGASAVSNVPYEKVFYSTPMLQYGALSTSTAVVVEVWTRSE
jgi:hypothetical protein